MPPPEKLFIYEIVGRVYPPEALTREDFLGCWREGDYLYLFFGSPREAQVKAWVESLPEARYSSETELKYSDWESGQPLQAASMAGFHLCPVWETPTPAAGEIVIRMEPGLAFGSGYHPTTQRCLELLRRVYEVDAPRQVLDLGTGTGILALAALALGADRVIAVEYNELAVRTAARNLQHNQRAPAVHLIQADARDFAHLPAELGAGQHPPGCACRISWTSRNFSIKNGISSQASWGPSWRSFWHACENTPLQAVEIRDENLWFTVLAQGPGDDGGKA